MVTGKVTILTLLDLFAACDTIDYSVLLDRLSDWYGISGTALTLFHSLLLNRFQSINIRKGFLNAERLVCGVPQCSVIRPLLLTLYTTRLNSLSHRHKLDHHLYADNTQVYISTADSDLSLV